MCNKGSKCYFSAPRDLHILYKSFAEKFLDPKTDKITLEKAAREKERLQKRRQYLKNKFQLLEHQATLGIFL